LYMNLLVHQHCKFFVFQIYLHFEKKRVNQRNMIKEKKTHSNPNFQNLETLIEPTNAFLS
jgi:hypothetical protein